MEAEQCWSGCGAGSAVCGMQARLCQPLLLFSLCCFRPHAAPAYDTSSLAGRGLQVLTELFQGREKSSGLPPTSWAPRQDSCEERVLWVSDAHQPLARG